MLKRFFDISVAAVLLIVLSPLMLAIAALVRFKLGAPVLYSQVRPGLQGRPFRMFKFRTMLDIRDLNGQLLPSDRRLTCFGKKLRATSLDELPELWNVLRGEMSLVGPRPLLMEYLPLYSPTQYRRHEVRPGITGWAQVNGRNHLSWTEKFCLDVWYVDNRTFLLDLEILALTIARVISSDGVTTINDTVMPRFKGNESERKRGRQL